MAISVIVNAYDLPSKDEDADEGAWWLVEEAEVEEKLLLAAEKIPGCSTLTSSLFATQGRWSYSASM